MQKGVTEEVANQINNFFSQISWSEEPTAEDNDLAQVDSGATDEELEQVAIFLA